MLCEYCGKRVTRQNRIFVSSHVFDSVKCSKRFEKRAKKIAQRNRAEAQQRDLVNWLKDWD